MARRTSFQSVCWVAQRPEQGHADRAIDLDLTSAVVELEQRNAPPAGLPTARLEIEATGSNVVNPTFRTCPKASGRHRFDSRDAAYGLRRLTVYGGSKAYVLAFSQSLRKEVAEGVRVQVVLPGATATEFWDIAGNPVSNLPPSWVMSADDMVDASLAGLDNGEFITIPALPDDGGWKQYEAARQAMMPVLSGSKPAARYRLRNAA